MSDQDCMNHIANCEAYLSQGDIFRIDLVAPMADPEKFIFRTVDGRHASNIRPDGTNGKIFTYDELLSVIEALPLEQRILPFQRTSDGKYERVLVYADLLKYFIIISHTCDISGVDGHAGPVCAIAPLITLAQHCRGQVLLRYEDPETEEKMLETVSIPDYITDKLDSSFKEKVSDCLSFSDYLRACLKRLKKRK